MGTIRTIGKRFNERQDLVKKLLITRLEPHYFDRGFSGLMFGMQELVENNQVNIVRLTDGALSSYSALRVLRVARNEISPWDDRDSCVEAIDEVLGHLRKNDLYILVPEDSLFAALSPGTGGHAS